MLSLVSVGKTFLLLSKSSICFVSDIVFCDLAGDTQNMLKHERRMLSLWSRSTIHLTRALVNYASCHMTRVTCADVCSCHAQSKWFQNVHEWSRQWKSNAFFSFGLSSHSGAQGFLIGGRKEISRGARALTCSTIWNIFERECVPSKRYASADFTSLHVVWFSSGRVGCRGLVSWNFSYRIQACISGAQLGRLFSRHAKSF